MAIFPGWRTDSPGVDQLKPRGYSLGFFYWTGDRRPKAGERAFTHTVTDLAKAKVIIHFFNKITDAKTGNSFSPVLRLPSSVLHMGGSP